MKYTVTVERNNVVKKYVVDVVPSDAEITEIIEKQIKHKWQETDPEFKDIVSLAIESSRLEYEHSFRRVARIDNKAYILLTVCGFIFVLLTSAINKIPKIDVCSYSESNLIVAYDVLLLLSIICIIALLGMLLYSLSGKDYHRYDTYKILEKNLLSTIDLKSFARYTIMKYELAKDYNDRLVTN